jgi:DNA polymerase (family 10)
MAGGRRVDGITAALPTGWYDRDSASDRARPMKNREIARLFGLMADVLEIKGDNPFRVRAYRRASQSLESLSEDIEVAARDQRLLAIPGIGGDLARKIEEYLATGRIEEVEAGCREIPAGVVELMHVPGVGPRTARLLHDRAGVTSVSELEALARAGRLRGLPGIQARTEANILKGIASLARSQARMPLARALPLARELTAALAGVAGVERLAIAGSIRRGRETVGDMDILVTSSQPAIVMEAFTALPAIAELLERGGTKSAVRHREGIQVDLRVVEPESFGAALVYFTGSKQHNIRIREMAQRRRLKISEYGVFDETTGARTAGATEEEVYRTIGLPWIPPELREDAGEIEAALAGRLPVLVEASDVRGDLHLRIDGADPGREIEALAAAARARGYGYLAISDRSPSGDPDGFSVAALLARADRLRTVDRSLTGIALLAGAECEVLPDGRLEYPDDALARFDIVVAAIHHRFDLSRDDMTRRMCAALEHPYVSVLAHPTGRVLGERSGADVDLDAVYRTAARLGKAVEINAHPDRLDLDDRQARRAAELGALVAISAATRDCDHLADVELGVTIARRGWIEATRVVNTWALGELREWIARSRPSRATAPARAGAAR